jgi:O-antigen ligase
MVVIRSGSFTQRVTLVFSGRRSGLAEWTILNSKRWLHVFFICALLMPPLPFPAGNSGFHVAFLVALLGLPAGIFRMTEWRTSWYGSLPFLLVLFLAALTGSVIFAEVYSGWKIAAGSLARVLLFGICVYVFLYQFIGPGAHESDSLRFARFLFWIGLLGAAFACVDFYFQLPAPAGYAPQFVWLRHCVVRRAQGVFYEASTLGNFCAFFLVMILAASFPVRGRRAWSWLVLIPGAVVFSAALIFSSSRASLVSVVVAGCAFVCMRGSKNMRVLIPMCVLPGIAGAAVRFALPAFSENYWSRIAASVQYFRTSPNGVLSGRITQWKMLADFLAQRPWHLLFGIGYKTLPYTNFTGAPVVADNTYLSLLVETGLAGLMVFVFLNAAILRTAYHAAKSTRIRASFFGTWIFCFWCGEIVQMFSGDLITYWRVLPVYFWVLASAARECGD